jgi:uncharacterized protein
MKENAKMQLFLSPHVHVYEVEHGGCFTKALHHAIFNHCYFLTGDSWTELRGLIANGELSSTDLPLEKLTREHMLVPSGYSANALVDHLLRTTDHLNRPSIGIIYVAFSTKCNLACDYCFVMNNMPNSYAPSATTSVEFDQIRSWLVSFLQTRDDRIENKLSIIGYGGEPLLSYQKLDSLFSELKDLTSNSRVLDFELITNGTLINESTVEFIKRHDVRLAVSIDGPKTVHDAHRRTRENRGTFDLIAKNLSRLAENDIHFGVSITLTDDNRSELTNFVSSLHSRFGVQSLGLNLLLYGGSGSPNGNPSLDNRALQECYLASKAIGVYEDRLGRKVDAFNKKGSVYHKDCGALGHQIVIDPDGSIRPCQAFFGSKSHILGHVNTHSPQDILESDELASWTRISPLQRQQCRSCPAVGMCGNGCVFDSEMRHGSLYEVNESFCYHTLEALQFCLKEAYIEAVEKRGMTVSDIPVVGVQDRTFQYSEMYERRWAGYVD